jgi:hypothetical protein
MLLHCFYAYEAGTLRETQERFSRHGLKATIE